MKRVMFAMLGICLFGGGAARAANLTWNLSGGGNWDTSTANWTGDRTTFVDDGGDNVTFNKTAGGTIVVSANMTPASSVVSASSGTYAFSGGPIDGGSLTKSGAGTLIVSNANGFSAVTLTAGTLQPIVGNALGTAVIALNTNAILWLGSAANTVYGNNVTVSGAGSTTIKSRLTGSSTSLTNTIGALTIGGQSLVFDWGGGSGNPGCLVGAVSLVGSPTLAVKNEPSGNSALAGLGAISEDGSSRALTVASPGSSTLRLMGAGSYSGGTVINGGGLQVSADHALGSGPVTVGSAGRLRASAAGAWRSSATDQPLAISVAGGGTLELHYSGSGGFSNAVTVTGSGTTTIQAGYQNGTNVFLGALDVAGVTLASGSWSIDGTGPFANPSLTFTSVTLRGNATFSVQNSANAKPGTWLLGPVGEDATGNRSLTKVGTGQLRLLGGASYSGGTAANGGTLEAATGYALGSGNVTIGGSGTLVAGSVNGLRSSDAAHAPLTVTIAPGGSLCVRADTPSDFGANVTLSGSGVCTVNVGRATFNTGVSHTLGMLTISNHTLVVPPMDSYFTGGNTRNGGADFGPIFSSALLAGNAVFNVGNEGSGNPMMITLGPVSEDQPGRSLTKQGAGKLNLAGAGSYSGDTKVMAGTLIVSNSLALRSSTLDYNYGGVISFSSLSAATFGGLKGMTNIALPNNFVLSVGYNGQNVTYDGQLSGTGASLVKDGTGIFSLSRTNTYTGPTVVTNGALSIDGLLSGSTSTVTVYAVLGGTGVINRAVTVASNGTIMAGATGVVSVLTVSSNLVLREGAQVGCDVTLAGIDRVVVGRTLTLPTNATVNLSYAGGGLPGPSILFSANALAGATNNPVLRGWSVAGGISGRVSISGTNVILSMPPGGAVFSMR